MTRIVSLLAMERGGTYCITKNDYFTEITNEHYFNKYLFYIYIYKEVWMESKIFINTIK